MALSIDVVTDPSDFDKIAPMDYIAWQTPYNPQLKHFRPNIPDPEAAIAAQKERSRKAFASHDPSKKWWVKATDTATSEIIGIAIWETNEPKLDANGEAILEKTVARWHPERSEEREFAERFIDGLWGFLAKRVTRPHMDLLSFVVHPKHRKRGAGRMLIRWGTAKADELGIETVISSLPSARGAYERSGLGFVEDIPPDKSLNVENPSEKWKELLDEDLSGCLMWRPVGHDYVEGVDKAPWTV